MFTDALFTVLAQNWNKVVLQHDFHTREYYLAIKKKKKLNSQYTQQRACVSHCASKWSSTPKLRAV